MKGRQKSIKAQKIETISEPEPINRQEKLGYFLKKVQDKVADLLDKEDLKIADKKVPFQAQKKDTAGQLSLRLQQLRDSKEQMQAKLKEVSEQERQIKSQQRQYIGQVKEHSLSPLPIKTKSQLSQTDISLLKRLKKQQRQFQQSLQAKTKAYQQKMKDLHRQQQQLMEKHKKQQAQSRKKQITQKLQQLSKQRLLKQKQYQQERLKIIQLKTKKKLYEQLAMKQKEIEKVQMENRINAMEERFKRREVDLEAIKEHQEKYKELKAEQQAERMKRQEELLQIAKESRINVEKSKFYTLVVSEAKKKKEEELKRMKEKIQLSEAAREYSESVKREHQPRVKTKSSEEQNQKDKHKKEGLTFQETVTVGNSYLQFMKQLPKKRRKNESSLTTQAHNTPKPLRTLSTKYKDYLTEQRKVRLNDDKMSFTRQSRIRDRGIMKQVEEACKLAGSKDNKQGLQRLQFVASKLQQQHSKDDHNMLDKISAKLKILQTLANR